MQKKIITAIDTEPVSLDDVRLHLRLTDDTTEDTLLSSLIERARLYCEEHTGRAFGTTVYETWLDDFPYKNYIELPMPPLQSVTSVIYVNSAGTETTMTATTEYLVDTDNSQVVLPYGETWPYFTPYPVRPVRIRYTSGYTTLPEPLKHAMLLMIGNWYENREDAGDKLQTISFSAKALLSQYKVWWLR